MKDEESIIKKSQSNAKWYHFLVALIILGILIGIFETFFDFRCLCQGSFISFIAIYFAILSLIFAFLFFIVSFIPQSMAEVAKAYPDAGGNAEWHARSNFRLGAMSNIGYAFVMLACAWMWPDGSGEVWHLFPAIFGAGIAIVVICQIALWIKHEPFRDLTVQSYALKAVLFILAMLAITIYWAYQPFYFDPIMVILLYTICSVVAGLLVGIRHQIAFQRSKSVSVE
jgi:hypothetical protein